MLLQQMKSIRTTKRRESEVFSKMSENAIFSLRFSQMIAEELFSKDVTPMHLFLGIVLNGSSLTSRTMVGMGVDVDLIVKSFIGSKKFTLNRKDHQDIVPLKLNKDTRDIIRIAFSIASKHSHVYVGTEHLMLALLESKDLEFVKELEKAGFNSKVFQENLANYATYPIGIVSKPSQRRDNEDGSNQLMMIGQDLVKLAGEGKLDPLVGRENELDQVINILSRRSKNNPIIVGDPGVGKTAVVEGLAQLIAAGAVPNSLLNFKIIALDLTAIIAGSKLRGDVEEKMMSVINEVIASDDTILFIDEIHNILGSSGMGGGSDIAAVLKPALLRDDFRVIGATTTAEYVKYFEEDNALVRRFQPITIEEPTIDQTIEILKRIEPLLEAHHNVNITSEAIIAAAKLSDRYVSDRFLPDKAIDLLDEASAARRLQLELKYKDVADLMTSYLNAVNRKESAVLSGDMKEAKMWQEKERHFTEKMDAIERKRARSKNTQMYKVDLEIVQQVVSKWTGIPVQTIDSKESVILKDLDQHLAKSVVGQEEAVKSVANSIKRARTGISDVNRPWASLLFLGPTGVGKTELAKVLTKILFGDEDRLIQIDMSEMMEMHSVSKLIGSPPGYVGYREGGQLTEKIRQRPHSVILFDEIEKAHPDVLNILLQIMEYGHLTDGKGRKVNFKNTVVILTSNIGAEEIQQDKILGFTDAGVEDQRSDDEIVNAYESMKDELLRELKDTLRPELLNRLDDVVIFRSLTRKDAALIVDLLVAELDKRMEEMNITVTLSKQARMQVVKEGFSEEYGARNLRRVLQDKVESELAEYILEHSGSVEIPKKNRLEIKFDLVDGKIAITNPR